MIENHDSTNALLKNLIFKCQHCILAILYTNDNYIHTHWYCILQVCMATVTYAPERSNERSKAEMFQA